MTSATINWTLTGANIVLMAWLIFTHARLYRRKRWAEENGKEW